MYLYAVKCQFAERMCFCGSNEFFFIHYYSRERKY